MDGIHRIVTQSKYYLESEEKEGKLRYNLRLFVTAFVHK